MSSIIEQVFSHAEKNADKIALTDGKKSLSYGELCRQVLNAQKVLKEGYGLKKGEAIILAANKQLSFVSVYFACHLLGVVVLPLAPDINERRLALIVNRVQPKLAIGLDAKCLICAKIGLAEFEDFIDRYEFTDIMFPGEDWIADILFTTGTTGEPKGVTLTQKNIKAAARNINMFIRNTVDDVEMLALPISHSFGLGRLRCALSNGQTVVILGSFANMKRFFRFMEEYKVTGFGMVPASWAMIKKLCGLKIGEFASQLKYIEIGSAPMPLEDKQILVEMLPNTRICMHYGLTEASRSAFMEFHEDVEYLDTIGKQSPNMYIEIRDDEGNVVPDGTEGEICVKGDAVTDGYYKLSKINEKSFWGDYFRTGDWGVKDTNGYIRLCSRNKELINVGGKKVSPIEIEELLIKESNIEDCACIAIPDPEGVFGEVVKAYIVTSQPDILDPGELNRRLSTQLEDYKLPVAYEIIDKIPKTSSGKVQRLLLKK